MRILPLLAGILALTLAADVSASIDSVKVTVVASGETHAMLTPCDCPNNPGGGLAERGAALCKQRDSGLVLLLDAGGFSGGGIYDDYTGGRAVDSQRSVQTIRAMGAMHYDVATVGDDDLPYGAGWLAGVAQGLPLVSANCTIAGKPAFPLFRVVIRNGVRFAITGVAPQERLFPYDSSCRIGDPVQSLRAIWKQMHDAADYRIILSHLGEEASLRLADSFPDADLIVNGHRKTSAAPVAKRGKTIVMQFGYEGKQLSQAVISWPGKNAPAALLHSGWIQIGPQNGADPAVKAVLADAAGAVKKHDIYDLYIMAQCPYGCAALAEFTDFVGKFPDVEWQVRFIGSVQNDSLGSLHGGTEVQDEMRWLAVQALYPAQWLNFLSLRSREGASTLPVAARLGLDTVVIDQWAKERGRHELASHYLRSMRLSVNASPTLFINNVPYEKPVESRRLAKVQCTGGDLNGPGCDSLPECFDDADCRKPGMLGRCLPRGSCEFTPDAAFDFTVLLSDMAVGHPENSVIATTRELFPGAAIKTIDLDTREGRALMKAHHPAALPFYLFGGDAAKAHNFSKVASGLVPAGKGFTFKSGITPANYFPQRPEMAGSAILLVDPLFPEAAPAITRILGDSALAKRIRIRPIVYVDPAEAAPDIEERVRREEAKRWLVLDSLFPDRFRGYLAAYCRNPGSTDWPLNLSGSGMVADTLARKVQEQPQSAENHWLLLNELALKVPMAFFIDNRRLVPLHNQMEFTEELNILKGSLARQ